MIKLVNVEKTYFSKAGNIEALQKTNIEVKEGEIFGIIGLSGAGKSTLIRCINMLEVPTGGQVFVDGQELTAMNESQLRKARQNIGMIFQHFNLLAKRKQQFRLDRIGILKFINIDSAELFGKHCSR